jgi:hypothetical protein
MPSGEEEEIAERGRPPVFFNGGAARAWLSSQIYNLIPGAPAGTTTTGPLLQHLAKFGRGFARTQKQRHKQA